MIRLLHLADVHLGASLSAFGDLATERREAVLDAFRGVPERAAELEVHAVLVAGDLFDSPDPSREARAAAAETFRRLVDAGTPVLVVPGNHDAITIHPNPWEGDLGGAHVFRDGAFTTQEVATDSGPIRVHGVAFDPAREPDPLATLQPGTDDGWDVVLVHASVQDAPHWKAGPNSLSVAAHTLAALAVDYVALGDHHAFRGSDAFPGRPDGAACCYAGSFAAVDLTETGPKGGALVTLSEDGAVTVEPASVHDPAALPPVLHVGPVDVTALEDDGAVLAAVTERIEGDAVPVVHLEGTPGFALDTELLESHLVERYGFASVRDRTRFYDSDRVDGLAGDDTIAGHLVREGRRRIEAADSDEVRAVAERALRTALSALGVE